MNTVLTASAEAAARFCRDGHLVAFPTETVYGLGAALQHAAALANIYAVKGRPSDNPMIVHVADRNQVYALTSHLSLAARALIERFFPGPLTLVLPRHASVPDVVTAGRDTVGIRMPDHTLAQAFLRACGGPVAAPSANVSGRPSPTRWQDVERDLGGRIACILQGEATRVGLESTVVDCTEDPPILLRAGGLSLEDLRASGTEVRLPTVDDLQRGRSPGTRYRHYAPRAHVYLVSEPPTTVATGHAYIGLDRPLEGGHGAVQRVSSVEEYAHRLFAFFRQCDEAGLSAIYCQTVAPTGLGRALMDRLQRAAEGDSLT